MGPRIGVPFNDVKSLVAYAKANPEKVTFGSGGTGGGTHLSDDEAFALAAGIKLTHVPFPGATPAVSATVGGTIDIALGFAQSIVPQAKGGRMVAIAQFGKSRAKILPDVPSFAEAGADLALSPLVDIWAPKATPDAVVQLIAAAVEKAATGPALVAFAQSTMTEVAYAGPEAFGREIAEESVMMKQLLTKLGLAA